MLTSAKAIKRHITHTENEIFHLKHTGDPDGRLPWLNVYIKVLQARYERAEATEKKSA